MRGPRRVAHAGHSQRQGLRRLGASLLHHTAARRARRGARASASHPRGPMISARSRALWITGALFLAVATGSLGCESRVALGGSCRADGDCQSPYVCGVGGRCRVECTTSDDCSAGERCLVDVNVGVRACSSRARPARPTVPQASSASRMSASLDARRALSAPTRCARSRGIVSPPRREVPMREPPMPARTEARIAARMPARMPARMQATRAPWDPV